MDNQIEYINHGNIQTRNVIEENFENENVKVENTSELENILNDSIKMISNDDDEVFLITQQAERRHSFRENNSDENDAAYQRSDSQIFYPINEMEMINMNELQIESPVCLNFDALKETSTSRCNKNNKNSMDVDKEEKEEDTPTTEEDEHDIDVDEYEKDLVTVDPIGVSTSDGSPNVTSEQAVDRLIPEGPGTESQKNVEWERKFVITSINEESLQLCMFCSKNVIPKYMCTLDCAVKFLCSEVCLKQLQDDKRDNVVMEDTRTNIPFEQKITVLEYKKASIIRRCSECSIPINNPTPVISWEAQEFCNAGCIRKYQGRIGSVCSSCKRPVLEPSLGKYCVRFGYHIRQFCSSGCLLSYKRVCKVCSFCQDEMVDTMFLANIGESGQYRDFCSLPCMKSYTTLKKGGNVDGVCSVCHKIKQILIKYCDARKNEHLFCGEPCFVAFKYVNGIYPQKCQMCLKFFPNTSLPFHIIGDSNAILRFCTTTCENIYININRKIVPCAWCKVKKYNFDMIQKWRETKSLLVCSLFCLRHAETQALKPSASKKLLCSNCNKVQKITFRIMVDSEIKNFCTYQCVQQYQSKNPRLRLQRMQSTSSTAKQIMRKYVTTTTTPPRKQIIPDVPGPLPIITSVRSLAATPNSKNTELSRNGSCFQSTSPEPEEQQQPLPIIKHIVIVKPSDLPEVGNVMTMVKPIPVNEETHVKPDCADKETQTDGLNQLDIEIIPVPIYVPQPIRAYSFPYMKPIPFPLPVPVPLFIPLTKETATEMLTDTQSAQPIPRDPYEADLLVMAELVAIVNEADSQQEVIPNSELLDNAASTQSQNTKLQKENTSIDDGNDELHVVNYFAESPIDLEEVLTANTITATSFIDLPEENQPSSPTLQYAPAVTKILVRGRGSGRSIVGVHDRRRATVQQEPVPKIVPEPRPKVVLESAPEDVLETHETLENLDTHMCLKYTVGVKAWKQWVANKNNEIEKSAERQVKLERNKVCLDKSHQLFKTNLLQLTADELNYSLCLFLNEVRKPDGAEYAPDTIYYLCLGIQLYLLHNGRIGNIFCDPYYENFTNCLDKMCRKFSYLYNDSQYIVTRVEEEHLWECKQLGDNSPYGLLTTLIFFNTKHFKLRSAEEHMQLKFSHIMKQWKRASRTPDGTRSIVLKFYPSKLANERNQKKRCYEQEGNQENPARCPVKLYDFYLSKCPESVKTRSDTFYLLPERSCVPDSPVWYTSMALGKEALGKILHRIKIVKEINIALLAG